MNKIDLSDIPKYIGQKFNSLTVIGRGPDIKEGSKSRAQAELVCDCGNTTYSRIKELKAGRKKSCGCKMGNNVGKYIEEGTVVNGITIGKEVEGKHARMFKAACHCGGSLKTNITSINKKTVTSCGCLLKIERNNAMILKLNEEYRHTNYIVLDYENSRLTYKCKCGYTNNIGLKTFRGRDTIECTTCSAETRRNKVDKDHKKLSAVYYSLKSRCVNPISKDYNSYGGKGIGFCKEWAIFENFFTWAKNNGYKQGLEIDREDPDGDYSPDNCRFITPDMNRLRVKGIYLSIQDVIFIRSEKFKWEIHRQFYKCNDKTILNIINLKTFKKVTLENYDEKGNYRF